MAKSNQQQGQVNHYKGKGDDIFPTFFSFHSKTTTGMHSVVLSLYTNPLSASRYMNTLFFQCQIITSGTVHENILIHTHDFKTIILRYRFSFILNYMAIDFFWLCVAKVMMRGHVVCVQFFLSMWAEAVYL